MCVVSMISGHYMQKWPYIPPTTYPWPQPTIPEWNEYQELLRKAREYDRIMSQPDCPDPAKEDWNKKMSDYMNNVINKELS
jgi:hypothetical protein